MAQRKRPRLGDLQLAILTELWQRREATTSEVHEALAPVFESYVITAPKPPADANTWFIAVTDERGAMVSTPVQFSP